MPRAPKQASDIGNVGTEERLERDTETPDPEIHSFTLRVQKEVIEQIDKIVSKHPVIRNRNTWIVNAIVEQLKREAKSN